MPRRFVLIHTSPARASYLQRGTARGWWEPAGSRCVTAHAFGSWRAVGEGSLGQGWQSSFMICRLFKRPHKKAPSILKGKWLSADRQGSDKAGIGSTDPSRDSAGIRLLLFFQRFIEFIQEGPAAQQVLG